MVLRTGWAVAAIIAAGCASAQPAPRPTRSALSLPRELTGSRIRPRPGAVRPGTVVTQADLFTTRVFATRTVGFALASVGSAQYPARSVNAGRTWRIDGPQVHIDAADGAEGVGYVGVVSRRIYYAYGSSVVDVSTNAGRTWWETYLGELVVAVVPGVRDDLVSYVQQQVGNYSDAPAVTWQYVSRDGGRHWRYTRSLGGG